MEKRFVYFSKKENFLKATQGTEYEFTSIVFIGDSKEIWNRGIFYGTPEDFDINDYLTKADAASTYQPVGNYLTEHQSLADYAKTNEVNSKLEGYYTKEEVDEALEGVDVTDQLVDYVKLQKFTEELAKKADLTAISDMATQTWVEGKGYETVTGAAGKYQPKGNYLTEHQSLENYATKQYADKAASDAIDRIVDGASTAMDTLKEVEEALKENDSTVTALNEAIGKKADKESVYTKTEADGKFLTEHQSLTDYAKTSEVESKIATATTDMATKAWVGQQNYLTEHQSLDDYYNKKEIDNKIDAVERKIPTLDAYAKKEYVDNAVIEFGKTVYTKEEVDDMWEWAEY